MHQQHEATNSARPQQIYNHFFVGTIKLLFHSFLFYFLLILKFTKKDTEAVFCSGISNFGLKSVIERNLSQIWAEYCCFPHSDFLNRIRRRRTDYFSLKGDGSPFCVPVAQSLWVLQSIQCITDWLTTLVNWCLSSFCRSLFSKISGDILQECEETLL